MTTASPSPGPPPTMIAGDPRPLPPGWICEIDQSSGLPYFVDTTPPNPQATWQDPRPAYYANLAKSNVHAPPAGPPPPPAYNNSNNYPLNAPSPAVAGSPNLGTVQGQSAQYYQAQPIQQQQQLQQQPQPQQVQQQQQPQPQPQPQPQQQPVASSSRSSSSGPNPMVASAAAGFGGAMLGGMLANSMGRRRAPPVVVAATPVRVVPGAAVIGGPMRRGGLGGGRRRW